jgi:hypothetical protein
MRRQIVKILQIISLSIAGFFAASAPVFAQIQSPVVFPDLSAAINAYTPLLRLVFTLIFIGMLIYGGFVYLTAGSDDGKVGNAKKIIVAAIGGFIIIALAPAIVQFIGALIGVRGGLIEGI